MAENNNLSIALEQAKDMYHARLGHLGGIVTKAGFMLAVNGIMISITTGIGWWTDYPTYSIFKILFFILALVSAVTSIYATFAKTVPFLGIKSVKENAQLDISQEQFTLSLLDFYEAAYIRINQEYRKSMKWISVSLYCTLLQILFFSLSLILHK